MMKRGNAGAGKVPALPDFIIGLAGAGKGLNSHTPATETISNGNASPVASRHYSLPRFAHGTNQASLRVEVKTTEVGIGDMQTYAGGAQV